MTQCGFAVLALALAASPAMAAAKRTHHHGATHQGSSSSEQMTTEQLNAQSLTAAQQGQNFTPAAPSAR